MIFLSHTWLADEEEILFEIGCAVGKPIKVDGNIVNALRGKFAWVYKVDLSKLLVSRVLCNAHVGLF